MTTPDEPLDPEVELADLIHRTLNDQGVHCRETFGDHQPDCFAVARKVIKAGWTRQ